MHVQLNKFIRALENERAAQFINSTKCVYFYHSCFFNWIIPNAQIFVIQIAVCDSLGQIHTGWWKKLKL